MASEDHDWKEAARVDGQHRAHHWSLDDVSIPNPVGRLDTGGLDALVRAWGEDGVPASVVNDLLQDLDAVEQEGGRYAQVFFRWMHRWYGDLGLVVLDPDDEALKASCAELWAREMRDEGVRHALEGTDAMEGPAHVRDNQLFWLGDEGRVGMVKDEQRGDDGVLEGRATCLRGAGPRLGCMGRARGGPLQPRGLASPVVPGNAFGKRVCDLGAR